MHEELTVGVPVLVIGRSVPPRSGGTPSIIANQLSRLGGTFIFVGQRVAKTEKKLNLRPGWTYYAVRPKRSRRPRAVREIACAARVAIGALRAVRRHGCRALILLLADDSYIAAGLIVAKIAQLPIVLYVADLWAEPPREGESIAWTAVSRRIERIAMSAAAHVVSCNAGLAKFCNEIYGVRTSHMPNCYPRDVEPLAPRHDVGDTFTIGYCGNIYWNNLDRMIALTQAIAGLKNTRLRIFGTMPARTLREMGLNMQHVEVRFVPDSDGLLRALSDCDVLFLPGAFDAEGGRAVTIDLMMPAKVLDYLGAGRPIILNCPAETHLAATFAKEGAALLVLDPSPDALASALHQLRADGALRAHLARKTYALARKHMDDDGTRRLSHLLRSVAAECQRIQRMTHTST